MGAMLVTLLILLSAASTEGDDVVVADIVGIDLGTTFSCVGVYRNGLVEIIPNEFGHRVTPSVVAFTEDGTLIGDAARIQAALRPANTVYDAKRLIGRSFDDADVQSDAATFPFKVVSIGGKAGVEVIVNGAPRVLDAAEISALVLGKMKQTAEAFIGRPVSQAVVTVRRVRHVAVRIVAAAIAAARYRLPAPRARARALTPSLPAVPPSATPRFLPTSTTRSGRRPRTRARSPASTSRASSTSRRRRRSRTGSTRRRGCRPCWSSTWAAARSTSRSSTSTPVSSR
jgi:hypothetical protein